MSEPQTSYSVSWIADISRVDKAAWDRLAVSAETPFMEWEWLRLLETTGCAAPDTGWTPSHLTLWHRDQLVAAAPLYIKSHSEGEFIFDIPWAEVANRLGVAYYPKLVGMTPFTPVPGYRFLISPGSDKNTITRLMLREIERHCRQSRLSGIHFLFADPAWAREVLPLGLSPWIHGGFAWHNLGYDAFDDFLAIFKSSQRKNIRRERRSLAREGIRIRAVAGDDIPRDFFTRMYRFYSRTNRKFGPWGCHYLNGAFFESLYDTFRHRLVFMAACPDSAPDAPVGMSLLAAKGDKLYGRYWGSSEKHHALHFETCYYAPIEWAIENGISRFDPGIGGGHKVRRGFESVPAFSLHRFMDPRLRGIMEHYMTDINREETAHIEAINATLPLAQES